MVFIFRRYLLIAQCSLIKSEVNPVVFLYLYCTWSGLVIPLKRIDHRINKGNIFRGEIFNNKKVITNSANLYGEVQVDITPSVRKWVFDDNLRLNFFIFLYINIWIASCFKEKSFNCHQVLSLCDKFDHVFFDCRNKFYHMTTRLRG